MWAESKLLGERLAAHGLENLSLTDMLRAMAPLLPGSKALGLIVLVRGVLVVRHDDARTLVVVHRRVGAVGAVGGFLRRAHVHNLVGEDGRECAEMPHDRLLDCVADVAPACVV